MFVAVAVAAANAVAMSGTVATSGATSKKSAAAHPDSTRAINDLSPGDHTINIEVDGRQRTFILHIPPSRVAHRPIILVFHGAEDSAESTIESTDFEQVADQDGEVVAFLQGYEDTWNEDAGDSPAALAHINDVAFTAAAIADIERLVSFDHSRIVATGFSNGALMVEDLGCRLASQLALIVPVEGQLPASVSKTCAPAEPLSVYEIHGTADTTIPYAGGAFVAVAGGTTVLSAPGSASRWATLDRCASPPTTSEPSASVTLKVYSPCRGGATVTLETIIDGAHEWTPDIADIVAQALSSL